MVLDPTVADPAGVAATTHVVVLPRGRRGAPDPDAITDAMASASAPALVLVRPPWADAAAAPIPAVALLLGHDVVWLPGDLAEAAWAAGLIVAWAEGTAHRELVRRAEVAVGLAALPACRVPRRPWGSGRVAMPALGATTLGRWCDRLWAPCARCQGGGAPGAPCPRCRHAEALA